jgi:uncharacterized membrane protein
MSRDDNSTSPSAPHSDIQGLSGMIFGLAISVSAITLVGNPPTTATELVTDLATFGFSFLILISVWFNYSKIMSALPLQDRRSLFLNTTILFLASIEPFLFNLLRVTDQTTNPGFANVVSVAYALNLGSLMIILGFFTSLLTDEKKKLIPNELMRQFSSDAISYYISGAFFLVSTLVPLTFNGLLLPLRYDLWFIPIVAPTSTIVAKLLPRRLDSRKLDL